MEFVESFDPDAIYGVAMVQPCRAIRKCRIRKLRIEYFISRNSVLPVVPRSCERCESFLDCINNIAQQIVKKFVDNQKRLGAWH